MKAESISIRPPFIKLDQLLKFAGLIGTGGEAKEVVAEGLVKVNGEVVTQRGKKVYPGDILSFGGREYEVTL